MAHSANDPPAKRPPADWIAPPSGSGSSGGRGGSGGKRRKRRRREPAPKPVGSPALLLLAVALFGVFGQMLANATLRPDLDAVTRSPGLAHESWTDAWSPDALRRHDPVSATLNHWESRLPLAPAAAHRLLNLLLHYAAALLLLRFLERAHLPAAFPATLLFALHPAVVPVLFWPGYRTEIVGLIAILGALHVGFRAHGPAAYAVTVLLTLFASLIHPAALAIPVILALFVFFRSRRFHLHDYNRVLPLACLCLFLGLWISLGAPPQETLEGSGERINYAGQKMLFYLRQALLPFQPALFHPYETGANYRVGAEMGFLPFLLFAPFFALAAFNRKKAWARALILGLAAYLALLVPGLAGIDRFLDGRPALSDHGQYIALPALIGLIVCGIGAAFRQAGASGKILGAGAFGLLAIIELAISAVFVHSVNQPRSMWREMGDLWPGSWIPKAGLARAVEEDPESGMSKDDRIDLLRAVLEQKPERVGDRIRLARLLRSAGRLSNAAHEYQRILRETDPSDALLAEAAELYEKLGMSWEASKARSRMSGADAGADGGAPGGEATAPDQGTTGNAAG